MGNFEGIIAVLVCLVLLAVFIYGLFTPGLLLMTIAVPVAVFTIGSLVLGAWLGWQFSRT